MTEVHPQTDELIITDDQFVRVLRLNRPERRNALSESLKMQLIGLNFLQGMINYVRYYYFKKE
jgi:hypothetical protein